MIRRILNKTFLDFYYKKFIYKSGQYRCFLQARKQIFSSNSLYLPNKQPWVGDNIQF